MPQVGRLNLDRDLLARVLNFPPEHQIVQAGMDAQGGLFVTVSGPSMPVTEFNADPPLVQLDTSFTLPQFRELGQPGQDERPQEPGPFFTGPLPNILDRRM